MSFISAGWFKGAVPTQPAAQTATPDPAVASDLLNCGQLGTAKGYEQSELACICPNCGIKPPTTCAKIGMTDLGPNDPKYCTYCCAKKEEAVKTAKSMFLSEKSEERLAEKKKNSPTCAERATEKGVKAVGQLKACSKTSQSLGMVSDYNFCCAENKKMTCNDLAILKGDVKGKCGLVSQYGTICPKEYSDKIGKSSDCPVCCGKKKTSISAPTGNATTTSATQTASSSGDYYNSDKLGIPICQTRHSEPYPQEIKNQHVGLFGAFYICKNVGNRMISSRILGEENLCAKGFTPMIYDGFDDYYHEYFCLAKGVVFKEEDLPNIRQLAINLVNKNQAQADQKAKDNEVSLIIDKLTKGNLKSCIEYDKSPADQWVQLGWDPTPWVENGKRDLESARKEYRNFVAKNGESQEVYDLIENSECKKWLEG